MRLKIVNLNLWKGHVFDSALDFLQAQQADMYVLQEAYDGHGDLDQRFRMVELLLNTFPEYDSFFYAGYLDTREIEGNINDGQLMLSKLPLQNKRGVHTDIPYGKYDHDAITDFSIFPAGYSMADVVLPDKTLQVINVHAPVNMNGFEPDIRRQEYRNALLNDLRHPAIVCGDFNMDPNNPVLADVKDELKSVFDYENIETTFNLKRKDLKKFPGYAEARVDMCFISPEIQVVNKIIPQVDVSDHLPLVIELEV